ncbi:MAG TPA: GntR family transcriptional regulator [Phnomibacter sp.]|nr:GntR family transcriptional regulator [Phnomibacter sp.]
MSSENIYRHIQIDDHSITPKYLQIVNSILKGIELGRILQDYQLPSINDLSFELDISRDTAEKAYKHLKQMGVVGSVPGKGYFISNAAVAKSIKVFLLFNKLSTHKKIIYDSFIATLGDQVAVDFYIYNNDFGLFKKLIRNRKQGYTHYVIIPHFLEGGEKAVDLINEIEEGELILLDKLLPHVRGEYGAVYEDFEADIFGALKGMLVQLSRYQTLKIIFPSYTYFPHEILNGFQHFCHEFAFNHKVVHRIAEETVGAGEVYINLMEDDLIVLLDKIQASNLQLGEDIGIISYNETPWKRFILDGITTISSDFKLMGEMAAHMVLKHEKKHVAIPFSITPRASL